MIKSAVMSALLAVPVLCAWTPATLADSNEAMCQVRKDGETQQGKSGPCTFSQRQGYIDLDLRNGQNFSLAPGEKPDHFKDQKGRKVVRTQAGGNTQEFKWEGGTKIVVTFGASSSGAAVAGGASGAVGVGEMPKFCAGEAAAKFRVNPRDISTQAATKTNGMYEVSGQYGSNAQVFVCLFNAEHQFLSVDLIRP